MLPSEDGDILKMILQRLTARATFPNTILRGKTLGGADDLQRLHYEGRLKQIFEDQGVRVLGNVERGPD